ncbi:hypothetical protein OVA10_11260 [Lelliottia sp. SL45]|uniref:hypothetical protein n=1 Tax=Lelliottia sp. SL45 TaxID=2994665 RepID=UPI002274C0AA|nr:hypothetical protein [Lelliottia sp. SL45]MCY1698622.1 hypothetical protein [Lelliottia sp. SL45]
MTAYISIAVLEVPAFCPVVECSECDDHSCKHNQGREKRIAAALAEYEQAQRNLQQKETALIAAIKG